MVLRERQNLKQSLNTTNHSCHDLILGLFLRIVEREDRI